MMAESNNEESDSTTCPEARVSDGCSYEGLVVVANDCFPEIVI